METRKLTVSGLVQRVGFRWSTMALANKMNIPGTVKNNSDGTVTIYLQSTPDKIDRFIEKLPSASGFAHIENIDQESVQNVEQMHDFHVLYSIFLSFFQSISSLILPCSIILYNIVRIKEGEKYATNQFSQ